MKTYLDIYDVKRPQDHNAHGENRFHPHFQLFLQNSHAYCHPDLCRVSISCHWDLCRMSISRHLDQCRMSITWHSDWCRVSITCHSDKCRVSNKSGGCRKAENCWNVSVLSSLIRLIIQAAGGTLFLFLVSLLPETSFKRRRREDNTEDDEDDDDDDDERIINYYHKWD